MTQKQVAILGSGPTGLVIAHAAEDAGIPREQISIFSHGRKSDMFGAQFLHGEVPGLPVDSFEIAIELSGSMPEYREKVYETYRDFPNVPAEEFAKPRIGWDIRQAYDELWKCHEDKVTPLVFEPDTFDSVLGSLLHVYRLVFTTMPMQAFCRNERHRWDSERVYAMGDSAEREIPIRAPLNTVRYNGLESPAWYRTSNIQGHCTAEWPAHSGRRRPPYSGVISVTKPLKTDCTCWPGLVRVGRYGQWKKGVLVHHAYETAMKSFREGEQGVLF